MKKRQIYVTVTPYEGDNFPEADHYPEYVAERLADLYSTTVVWTVGSRTLVSVYKNGRREFSDLDDEIEDLVKVGLWNDFCSHGYKEYMKSS
jgi:hypothetical protein